ncbi:MAG: anti-sigma factor family protein [Bradymonadia bacterium]|jgi:negative regulator of sigma E activity
MNKMHDKNDVISPLQLSAYFDGEIQDKEELEQIEALIGADEREQLAALSEMRELLRFNSEQELEEFNPNVLWNRINREIFDNKAQKISFWQRLQQFFKENSKILLPVAAFSLLTIITVPVLVSLTSQQNKPATMPTNDHTTYVFLDAQGSATDSVSYTATKAPVIWFNREQNSAQSPDLIPVQQRRQLTIQEMDAAIHHLLQRIDELERHNGEVISPRELILRRNDISPALQPNF